MKYLKPKGWFVLGIFLIIFLSGCASKKGFLHVQLPPQIEEKKAKDESFKNFPQRSENIPESSEEKKEKISDRSIAQEKPPLRAASPIIFAPPKPKSWPAKGKIPVEINFEGADLLDFLDLLFKETLKLNYVVEPQVRAKITAHIKGEFNSEELISLTAKVLELQGISLIREGNLIRLVPTSEIGRLSKGLNFLLLRPRYVKVQRILNLMKLFTSRQASITTLTQQNILLVIDDPERLAKIEKIFSILDSSSLQDFVFYVYQPKVLSAEKLADYLQKIFRSQVLRAQGFNEYLDFIPIKEIGALVILAKYPEDIARARSWLAELDTGEVVEEQIFIYPVENGEAEEIAKILQDIFSERPSSQRETIVKAIKGKQKGTPGTGVVAGKVKIVPDIVNNLLVIRASKEDYRVVERLLKQLDVMPRQVLIEVLIAEVSLNRSLEYGVEWFIKTQIKLNGREYPGTIGLSHKGAAPAIHGQDTTFTFTLKRYDDLRFLLKALDSVSDVRILSSPVLLASNGKEAFIQIGAEVPIVSREVANTGAETPNVTRSIQYRDTGIILKVKPFINSSGLVKLDVEQEVSQAHENYLGLDSPLFSKRKIVTSLVVRNNQTIILGGLIDNKSERGETGIPLLRRLPGVGNFFKWQTHSAERTELLVAITPRVVRSMAEVEEVMHSYRQRIEQLKKVLGKM